MIRMLKVILFSLALIGLCGPMVGAGEDWPQWRGPARDGHSKDTSWGVAWPGGAPKKLWTKQIGQGYSAVVVADGKAYGMGNANGQDTVWCVNADNGSDIWKHSYRCGTGGYPGVRATPALDGAQLYTYSREGLLHCYDAAKGTVTWSVDTRATLGAKVPKWGLSSSPLVHGQLVYVQPGGAGACVVAFNKADGKLVWKWGSDHPGYSAPSIAKVGAVERLVIFSGNALVLLDAAKGTQLARFPWKTSYDVNAADPIVVGTSVFISSDYGTGCALLNLATGQPKQVYAKKEMGTHTNGCVLVNGKLYGFDGNITKNGNLRCMDYATGQVHWSQPGMGSLIASNGKLIILTLRGELIVAEANPAAYKEVAKAHILGGKCWTTPSLANGKLYVRNTEGEMACFDLSGK